MGGGGSRHIPTVRVGRRRRHPAATVFRWALIVSSCLIFAWAAGLVWFVGSMNHSPADTTTRTDAIVVLTGGSKRLKAGIELLKRDSAPVLFLSGVNRKVEMRDILRLAGNPPAPLAKRIVLGYRAEHTRGNAAETALWFNSGNRKSLRLVTANYHMPRSLLELRRELPDAIMIANPVAPISVQPGRWWRSARGLTVVFKEYNKYLLAMLRLSRV